jgi:hypothetical protein
VDDRRACSKAGAITPPKIARGQPRNPVRLPIYPPQTASTRVPDVSTKNEEMLNFKNPGFSIDFAEEVAI